MNSVEKVKELCKNRKIPISKLEKDLGYSNGYISQLKKGVFPSDRLSEIANYLNVSFEYLMNPTTCQTESASCTIHYQEKEIEKIIVDIEQILQQENLLLEGKPVTPQIRNILLVSLHVGVELAKKNLYYDT